jgi:hypothetical protein
MASTRLILIGIATLGLASGACRGEQAAPLTVPPASAKEASLATPKASTAPPRDDDDRASPAVKSAAPAAAAAPSGAPQVWSFETDKAGGAPAGFSFGRTGSGAPGRWIVQAEPGAPSGANVLAQVSADGTDSRFPVAVADTPELRDVRLSVRCKPVSGSVDQACGLVFRYRDENNYYLTRANALENNVRLYIVKHGHRKQLESWSGPVTSKAWHELRVDARGDRFEVYWEGKKIIDAHDQTFPDAGKVGVWTKADSVTYFDDLSATPL